VVEVVVVAVVVVMLLLAGALTTGGSLGPARSVAAGILVASHRAEVW
jgi:hypothetical protein